MPRAPSLGLATAAVALATALASGSSALAATNCSLFASPAGADVSVGSEQAPFRSVQKLVDSLSAGQTGCLRAGHYQEDVKVSRPGITLTRYGAERVTVRGRLWVAQGADDVTVEELYLDGANEARLPSPSISGRNVTFRRNDVTNGHTSICFSLGHPHYGRAIGTKLEFNRIHDCGILPAANHDHGIYLAAADDTQIIGNWIYDNADRGIQIYPDAQRTVVRGNVIDGNGQGVIFGGEGSATSNDSTVEGNVISNSIVRDNVESYYPDGTPLGRGNVVTGNCIGGGVRDDGDGGIAVASSVALARNLRERPRFRNRTASDFRLDASRCRSVLAYADQVPGPDGSSRAAPSSARRTRAVSLRAPRRARAGRRLALRGRVASERLRPALRVIVLARGRGRWYRAATARVRADGSFAARARIRGGRRLHAVRVRALVRRVGRSRTARVALRG
jgi:Right handed beta helix region